jgi:hypothetical protein
VHPEQGDDSTYRGFEEQEVRGGRESLHALAVCRARRTDHLGFTVILRGCEEIALYREEQ